MLLALVVAVVIVAVLFAAMSGPGAAAPSQVDESGIAGGAERSQSAHGEAEDTSRSTVAVMVGGFGLITAWIATMAVTLTRAQRRQKARSTTHEST